MKKGRLLLVAAIFFVFPVPSANALNLQKEILGKWYEVGKTETMEFFKDGTISVVDEKKGAMAGNYKFLDDDRMRVEFGGIGALAGLQILKVSISKGQLVLTDPTGKIIGTYQRTKTVEKRQGNDADAYMKRGMESAQSGNYQQAIKEYSKVIELAPQKSDAYARRADAFARKGDYEQAIKDYDKAIELGDVSVSSYHRATMHYLQGNYQKAINDYSTSIELLPKNDPRFEYILTSAQRQRITSYSRLGNDKKAIEEISKLIGLDSKKNSAIYAQRGVMYARLGNYQQGVDDCNKAIELNPKGMLYSARGYVYGCLAKYDQAINECKEDIKIAESMKFKNWFPYINMAAIYSFQGNAAMACNCLTTGLEKGFVEWGYLKFDRDFDKIRNSSCFQNIIKDH